MNLRVPICVTCSRPSIHIFRKERERVSEKERETERDRDIETKGEREREKEKTGCKINKICFYLLFSIIFVFLFHSRLTHKFAKSLTIKKNDKVNFDI